MDHKRWKSGAIGVRRQELKLSGSNNNGWLELRQEILTPNRFKGDFIDDTIEAARNTLEKIIEAVEDYHDVPLRYRYTGGAAGIEGDDLYVIVEVKWTGVVALRGGDIAEILDGLKSKYKFEFRDHVRFS